MPREISIAFHGRYLDVIWANGAEYTRHRLARGVVLIVPVTTAGSIVLLEQYRVSLRSDVVEFPAGLVGDEDAGEDFEAAARRELLEESGFEASSVEFLLRGPSSPGSSAEVVDFFLARDVTRVHAGGGVAHERIRVHEVPLCDADSWLEGRVGQGVMVDPRVYLGLHLARTRAGAGEEK